LNIIKVNKDWEDKKANKEMLAIFKELGNSSPLVQSYRKHMQRAMY
jgi:thioredoxin-like negative regulator of GroEL